MKNPQYVDLNDEAPVHSTTQSKLCSSTLIRSIQNWIGLDGYEVSNSSVRVRIVSQGFFEMFLNQQDVKETSFPPVFCSNGHPQERDTIIQMLSVGKEFLFCIECGQKTQLPAFDLLRLYSYECCQTIKI